MEKGKLKIETQGCQRDCSATRNDVCDTGASVERGSSHALCESGVILRDNMQTTLLIPHKNNSIATFCYLLTHALNHQLNKLKLCKLSFSPSRCSSALLCLCR